MTNPEAATHLYCKKRNATAPIDKIIVREVSVKKMGTDHPLLRYR